jgi:hypothetical protein
MIEKRIQFGIRNVGQNLWLPSSEEVFGAEFDPLEAWFRADVVSSLITAGSSVTTWNNLVDNTKFAMQSDGGADTPTTGGNINGVPALQFTNPQRLASNQDNIAKPSNGNLTVVTCVDIGAVNQTADSIFSVIDADGNDFKIEADSTTEYLGKYAQSGLGGGFGFSGGPYSGPHIVVIDLDFAGSNVRARIDGNGVGVSGGYNVSKLGRRISAKLMAQPAGNRQLGGQMAEFIMACFEDNGFTDSQAYIEKCEGYLAWKYGLQGQLPVSHPYKTQPPREDNSKAGAANVAPTAKNQAKFVMAPGTPDPYRFSEFSSSAEAAFGYSDPEGSPMTNITVKSLPADGTLKLSGVNVTVDQEISTADIEALNFTYDRNSTSQYQAFWNFSVSDGTADSGIYTFTLNVEAAGGGG